MTMTTTTTTRSPDDDLYSALQAVLIRPNATRGILITLQGQGTKRPYDYRDAVSQQLRSTNFFTNLFGIRNEKHHGIFVLAALKRHHDSHESLNLLAHAALGLQLYGDVIITSAERCGHNQYLYNLGPICPNAARDFLQMGRLPAMLRPQVSSAQTHPRNLDIGVSVSIHESYREWWEAFSQTKKDRVLQMDKQTLANLGAHIGTFLDGIVSVWCALCGAKYRRLRLCKKCQCVAYCERTCLRTGFAQHQEICDILAGSTAAKDRMCNCDTGERCKSVYKGL